MNDSSREYAMNLLATMIVQDRAKHENREFDEIFSEFRKSDTFARLYDSDTELWMNGPDYISDEYDIELQEGSALQNR